MTCPGEWRWLPSARAKAIRCLENGHARGKAAITV
jgi:hypothetical protein